MTHSMENSQDSYSGYREYPCAAELRPYVECYWSRRSDSRATHRVLPDGCIDIIVDFCSAPERSFVIGAMTRPLLVNTDGRDYMVAVRFRPAGAYAFFSLPMSRLTDLRVSIRDLWKDTAAFEGRMSECSAIPQQIAALECELLRRLPNARPVDPRIGCALRTLARTTGLASIDSLSAEVGLSRQHLARKFDEQVGLSPKRLARVIRMQDLVRRVREVHNVDWAALALDCGYYDQAHMISDFREFTGLTPARFHFSNI